MSVAKAQEEIDSLEFSEWIAFDRISPIGDERAELSAAIIASTTARAAGIKVETNDFIPNYIPKKETIQEKRERIAEQFRRAGAGL